MCGAMRVCGKAIFVVMRDARASFHFTMDRGPLGTAAFVVSCFPLFDIAAGRKHRGTHTRHA